MARGDPDAAHDSVRETLGKPIARNDLAEALYEFADLHNTLGIDVTEIVDSIRQSMET
jgi:hypothetical protein